MANIPTSQYADLYKNRNSTELLERKQSDRRQQLLDEQKEHRSSDQDDSRNIQQFLQSLQHKVNKKPKKQRVFKNYVQLSEWLHERPDDLDQWFMVPCPKGMRCIVVATNGATKIYSKYGVYISEFRSSLPGDIKLKHTTTILDCFSITTNGTTKYMVLDVMFYANTEMLNCESSFRFFWIACKLSELQLNSVGVHNEFEFVPIKFVDCGDEVAVDSCLTTYPMWDDENIHLDGLLFYHKESSYVHGTTPLVGWLFSFMVNEILGFCMIHPKYLEQRPANYQDAATYIEDFDKELKEKKRSKRVNVQKMEEDVDDENGTLNSILNAERMLELEGRTLDDVGETMERD